MKTYTIIGGINGTGKSSLTGVLKAETQELGTIIDVDKLNIVHGGVIEGGKAAVRLINECLQSGSTFTQETTLSGRKTAATAKQARDAGYHVRLYYVGLDTAEESVKRIRNRVQKGGHDIPTSDVLRRFSTRFADILAVLPYCDEAVFYDNENGFMVAAVYQNGELVRIADPLPLWVTELERELKKE